LGNHGKKWIAAAVVSLLVTLAAELVLSIRQQSQTFDESAHLYAGYSYWKRGDYGINPEHPPLAKLLAAVPLLPLKLPVPPPPTAPAARVRLSPCCPVRRPPAPE